MTADNFTDAARAEAERKHPVPASYDPGVSQYERLLAQGAFRNGAEWARAHLAAQEPTDAGRRVTYIEVEAYLAAFSEDLPPDTEWTPDTIARVRRGLTAAYATRRDEENR